MRFRILLLVSILVGGWVVGCGDDSVSPPPGQFSVSISNLPQLPADQYYEAWARFPDSVAAGNPLLHGELEAVSLGAFTVASDGTLWSTDGKTPAQFALSEPRDLNVVRDILVTVESALEDTIAAGPAILGGIVEGNDDEGHASLTTTYHDAITDTMVTGDLTTAQGQCILATPTTSAIDDENHGVWFVANADPPQIPSLELPVLGEGWVYAAWISHQAEPVQVGEFSDPAAADSDSAGAEAGPGEGFDAPGSDFMQPAPRDLADGATTVVVALAPAAHEHGLSLLLHDEPFPLTVLELAIPLGARPDSAMTLTRPTTPLPTANIIFTR